MAVMHPTTLVPSKLELLAAWLPTQPWFHGDPAALERVGAYRLDDPAGEVGLEGLLITAGDATVYHVPLSYRAAPLPGGDAFLVGTMQHGVLGERWASDAVGDPVYREVIARIIVSGGHEAEEFVSGDGGALVPREVTTRLFGSGVSGFAVSGSVLSDIGLSGAAPAAEAPDLRDSTVIQQDRASRAESDLVVLEVVRALDPASADDPVAADEAVAVDEAVLRASWPGLVAPMILARLFVA